MTEPSKTEDPSSLEDALAFGNIQELAQIQINITELREAIPALLSPLLRPPPQTTTSSTTKTDPKAQDIQLEFTQRATKVQADVAALVKNLERMCETLEAAEKVRNEDYNERGEFQSSSTAMELQRTEIAKEELEVAPPIENGQGGLATSAQTNQAFLFDEKTAASQSNGLKPFENGALFEDFGLDAYNDTWRPAQSQ